MREKETVLFRGSEYELPTEKSPSGFGKMLANVNYYWKIQVFHPYFGFIKEGKKKIDGRVPDFSVPMKNYRKMIGYDIIEFQLLEKGEPEIEDHIEAVVKSAKHYDSLDQFFKQVSFKDVMPDAQSISEAKEKYLQFPGYKERIKQNGIYAIQFDVLEPLSDSKTKEADEGSLTLAMTASGVLG